MVARFVRCPNCNWELRLTRVDLRVPNTPFPASSSGPQQAAASSMQPPALGDSPLSPAYDPAAGDSMLGSSPKVEVVLPTPTLSGSSDSEYWPHPGGSAAPPDPPPASPLDSSVPLRHRKLSTAAASEAPPGSSGADSSAAPQPPATLAELFGTAEDEVKDEDTGEHKEMGNGDGSVGSEEQSGKRPRLE
jgi:hypothetical protein